MVFTKFVFNKNFDGKIVKSTTGIKFSENKETQTFIQKYLIAGETYLDASLMYQYVIVHIYLFISIYIMNHFWI